MAKKTAIPEANLKWKEIPFMSYKSILIGLSALCILVSFYFIKTNGFNFGVDFTGGIKLVYQFKDTMSEGKLRESLDGLDLGNVQIVRFGKLEENSFLIKIKYHPGRQISTEVQAKLKQSLGDDALTLLSEETVGPKVGAELRKRGMAAVVLTWILILIYIGIRFDFLFSPGAVLALIHDLIITIGVFVYFDKEINLPILAAALTIIGYSINDTIVVYDRIRENIKKLPARMNLSDLVNRSINETMARTIVTSLTLLFALLVLFYLGGGVLHDFAFCMILGVVTGTYSSIFIAVPTYLLTSKFFPGKGMVRGK